MLTSGRQGWDFTVIKKAYTTLILLYSACWKRGDSSMTSIRRSSQKQGCGHVYLVAPRGSRMWWARVRGPKGPREVPTTAARRIPQGPPAVVRRSSVIWVARNKRLTKCLRQGGVDCGLTHGNEGRGVRIAAAWGGALQEPRNTWVTWPPRENGLCSPQASVSGEVTGPSAAGAHCFHCSCHNE